MTVPRLSNQEISKELNELTVTLNKVSYINSKKAKNLSFRLENLLSKIEDLLSSTDIFSKSFLEEQKTQIITLFGRCDNLIVDSEVVELAEQAEKLSIETEATQTRKITELKKAIDQLKTQYALSQENRKIVRFAEILMDRCSNKNEPKKLNSDSKDPLDMEIIAFTLFELGQNLYYNEFSKANESYYCLPKEIQEKLELQMEAFDLDLKSILQIRNQKLDSVKKSIQVIIGFCDQLTLYNTKFVLPALEEIDGIFEAKEF